MSDLYDTDFMRWTERQTELLRRMAAGEQVNEEPDWLNLAEEIESAGAREKREVRSLLRRICHHLLRWRYQPEDRSPRWRDSIYAERQALLQLFEDSPSLRPFAENVLPSAFTNGRQDAEQETGALGIYDVCPWSFEQLMSQDFLPDGP
ncbi:MAG TPA: DUF29 domain-containing protein [Acetobacteraceae bacterium]|jgi:hypothetical protein|nr:DUF29 domain-containing protein [Acetobacteraceae bacterium]